MASCLHTQWHVEVTSCEVRRHSGKSMVSETSQKISNG